MMPQNICVVASHSSTRNKNSTIPTEAIVCRISFARKYYPVYEAHRNQKTVHVRASKESVHIALVCASCGRNYTRSTAATCVSFFLFHASNAMHNRKHACCKGGKAGATIFPYKDELNRKEW